MLEGFKIRTFDLHIKQRIILGTLICLVTFAGGLAVAFLTTDPTMILQDAAKIQDRITYKVITNGG